MRHRKKLNHLGRKSAHRKAMLRNMANSLLKYKRINTTVAKAKALRVFLEPLITKAKDDSTHNRRVVFSYLQDKESIKTLFGEVSSKVGDRPGGYTRILRTVNRLGDNAEMCFIELVDFNEEYSQNKGAKTTKKKRSRRGSSKKKSTVEQAVDTVKDTAADVTEAASTVETVVEESVETTQEVAETVAEEVSEATEEVTENVKEVKEEAVEETAELAETAEETKDAAEEASESAEEENSEDDKKDENKEA